MMAPPMRTHRFTATEFATALAAPETADALSDTKGSVVVVALDDGPPPDAAPAPLVLATLPAVVVGTSASAMPRTADLVDVVVPPEGDDLAATVDAVAVNPLAATSLALVLRGSEGRSVAEGLQLESAVYGTLQEGPEFAAWRASRPVHPPRPEAGPAVTVHRDGDRLELVLNRPAVRNALDARMRDELVAGLAVAAGDPSVAEVRRRGAGSAFCAGGDLDEFGSRPDVATAHLVRMTPAPHAPWRPWPTGWSPTCTGPASVRASSCRRSRPGWSPGPTRSSGFPRCPWGSSPAPAGLSAFPGASAAIGRPGWR